MDCILFKGALAFARDKTLSETRKQDLEMLSRRLTVLWAEPLTQGRR
jgi:hypothetical protein